MQFVLDTVNVTQEMAASIESRRNVGFLAVLRQKDNNEKITEDPFARVNVHVPEDGNGFVSMLLLDPGMDSDETISDILNNLFTVICNNIGLPIKSFEVYGVRSFTGELLTKTGDMPKSFRVCRSSVTEYSHHIFISEIISAG